MIDQSKLAIKSAQPVLTGASATNSYRQRRLMIVALSLLLGSLAAILYRDRDFWFPDTEQAESVPLAPSSEVTAPAAQPVAEPVARNANPPKARNVVAPRTAKKDPPVKDATVNDPPPSGPIVTRTVLPPLEVEVVAGDAHRTLHPGSSSVHVELERPRSPEGPSAFVADSNASAASVTTPAAQHSRVSTIAASSVVTRSVQPDYPMLARQMRVQGSVILQALIGRDGLIQDLRVVSGPPILANAAQEAVRQWHFKPHLVGTLPVETRANITVNFTISTN